MVLVDSTGAILISISGIDTGYSSIYKVSGSGVDLFATSSSFSLISRSGVDCLAASAGSVFKYYEAILE